MFVMQTVTTFRVSEVKGRQLDLYQVLGIARDATHDEVKKAYRAMAKKHHPDSGGDKETFQLISLAGSVLTDPESRERYDQTGQTDAQAEDNPALIVASLLEQAFMQDHKDPIRWMCEQVDEVRAEHRKSKATLGRNIEKLNRKIQKFVDSNKSSKNVAAREMIVRTLKGLVEQAERQVAEHEHRAEVGTKVLEFLNDLKCPSDFENAFRNRSQFGTSYATFLSP